MRKNTIIKKYMGRTVLVLTMVVSLMQIPHLSVEATEDVEIMHEEFVNVEAEDVETTNEEYVTETYESNLPVVYIDTEGGADIVSKEEYINATMRIQGNDEFSEADVLYEGEIEIRGRGNTTWTKPKKPYRIKLDKKANLCGMGSSKHWVLLANYMDRSLMRNTLAYNLSGSMGMTNMSTVWVDVVLNGEYIGNYQLCENIRIDENRVDIFDWESFVEDAAEVIAEVEGFDKDNAGDLEEYMLETDMSWITSGVVEFNGNTYKIEDYPSIEIPAINGGYLLELDSYYDEVSKFKTNSGQPIMFNSPEFVATNQDMMNYVSTYVQAFEDAVQSEDYTARYMGESTHYSELYDMDSLVDYWLVCEIFFQEEMSKKSTYMYKDIDELMHMGPVWDMDWSAAGEGDTHHTDKWATTYFSDKAQRYSWYKYLVQDPYFLARVQERYWEIREEQVQDMVDSIPIHYEYLKDSAAADGETWGYSQDFKTYVDVLETWLNAHLAWMDSQMGDMDKMLSGFSYNATTGLDLTMTDKEGKALEADLTEEAPSDGLMFEDNDVILKIQGSANVSGTAKIYVNSIELAEQVTAGATECSAIIPGEALTAEAGGRNVIEVKVYAADGQVLAANFVTVREKACEHVDFDAQVNFADVATDTWMYLPSCYVYNRGIMTGTGNDENGNAYFAPTEWVTREQLAQILYSEEGKQEVVYSESFPDVDEGKWYTAAVLWAAENGIVSGYDNGKYGVGDSITREQLAVMLYQYAAYKGYDITARTDFDKFTDANSISPWATQSLQWAVANGVMSGKGEILDPAGSATRAECAAMLRSFLLKFED